MMLGRAGGREANTLTEWVKAAMFSVNRRISVLREFLNCIQITLHCERSQMLN